MKYFTPDLIEMGQSEDDDVLARQDQLWAEAVERYNAALAPLRPSFPKGLKKLTRRYDLHDARVREMASLRRYFLIRLQLDTPPHPLLDLRYRLLWPHEVSAESLPSRCRTTGQGILWYYSEVSRLSNQKVGTRSQEWIAEGWSELAQATSASNGRGAAEGESPNGHAEWPFWQHSILLSNGWELTLAFRDVEVEEFVPIAVPYSPYQEHQPSTIRSA